MSKHLLVAIADKNYLDKVKQLFSSVYFNAGWKGDYMLMVHDVPEKDLEWFTSRGILVRLCDLIHSGEVSGIIYPPIDASVPAVERRGIELFRRLPIVLSKFELFTDEFKKWDTILYLDCDIIVRHSLEILTKVKGFYAGADFFNTPLGGQFYQDSFNRETFTRLEHSFDLHRLSFNTGVMAFSTDIIKNDTYERLYETFRTYHTVCIFGDQPILNLFFYTTWKKLHVSYNFFTASLDDRHDGQGVECAVGATILHSCSHKKLWLPESIFYDEWKSNLEKADQIDLDHRPDNATAFEMLNPTVPLPILNESTVYRIRLHLIRSYIDRYLGLVGIFLKKYFPKIYMILKSKI